MTKVEDGWVKDDGTKLKESKCIPLNSGAILGLDDLDNVWYYSDVEMIIGKIFRGRFEPTPRQDFSPELLIAVADLFKKKFK